MSRAPGSSPNPTDDRLAGDLVADLSAPGGELIETHISWVFLQGEDTWKVKKPVALGFLDFSSSEKRRVACEAEVRLNRRLAPGVYHGCVPITREPDGQYRFGGSGEVVDWAVHMTRMPRDRRADLLLARGELGAEDLERVAELLAEFHAAARADASTARHGTVDAIEANVRENFVQTHGSITKYLDPEQVEEVKSWQLRFLQENPELFAARLEGGKVRDGHGDLRLEHIYLDGDRRPESGNKNSGEIVVLDCIEFNERFRFADVCADIAFLAMDLAWHDHAELAERFLAAYARASNDFDLYPLIDFYESYRAFVRGKISCFVADDPAVDSRARDHAAHDARRYFLLALASGRRSVQPPEVVAVGGVIASGKSTVSKALAAELAAPIVDADRTRKFLLGVSAEQPVHVAPWQGAYSAEASAKVYAEVLRRADAVLRSGRPVVIDASFRSCADRAAVRQLAEDHDVPFHFVECRAAPEVCRERLRRRDQTRGVSDGRLAIFDDFLSRWEPVDELPPEIHTPLDTTRPLATALDTLRRRSSGRGDSQVGGPSSWAET